MASLDGYIADERDDVGPLHDWYFNGDHPLVDGHLMLEDPEVVIQGDGVLHLRYPVHRGR